MPHAQLSELRRTRWDFYCPAGHVQRFAGRTEVEKLREELERKNSALAQAQARAEKAEREAAHQAARVRGFQGAFSKAKARIAEMRERCDCPEEVDTDTPQEPEETGVEPVEA
jgi:predicted nuclease with TOPRIM domain